MKPGGETFHFKNFAVQHDRCAMRVSTDAVVLGALIADWLRTYDSGRRVLDIGTGSGVLSLMLAQESNAEVVAVEIDQDAAEQAGQNFNHSPWKGRLISHHVSFQEYWLQNKPNSFDSIVSNPPFFETPHPVKTPLNTEPHRAVARFEESLPFASLIEGVVHLLRPTGCFTVIVPYSRGVEFTALAVAGGLFLFGQIDVVYKARKSPGRSILRFARQRVPFSRTSLILHDSQGRRTEEFARLTQNFYV